MTVKLLGLEYFNSREFIVKNSTKFGGADLFSRAGEILTCSKLVLKLAQLAAHMHESAQWECGPNVKPSHVAGWLTDCRFEYFGHKLYRPTKLETFTRVHKKGPKAAEAEAETEATSWTGCSQQQKKLPQSWSRASKPSQLAVALAEDNFEKFFDWLKKTWKNHKQHKYIVQSKLRSSSHFVNWSSTDGVNWAITASPKQNKFLEREK